MCRQSAGPLTLSGYIALALIALGPVGAQVDGPLDAAVDSSSLVDSSGLNEEESGTGSPVFRLSRPVHETLAQLQDRWLLLNSAILQGDERLAKSAVNDLRNGLETLGFDSAPELGLAMVVRGLEASRQGDDVASDLAFELAEVLDPGSSALLFARSRSAWSNGHYFAALGLHVRGYLVAFEDVGFRRLALRNVLMWWMLSLLVSSAVFIGLQFATKGALLFKDLRGLVPVAPMAGGIVAILLLLLPFFFPNGWLWVGFVWAVLLWSYVSTSERWVLAACILCLGAVPSAFDILAYDLPVELTSEGRLLDRLEARRVNGRLLDDLAKLGDDSASSPAVQHLLADIHQRLGQDDIARPFYRRVVDAEPINGPALNNLGVFHARRRERVAAIDFLQAAAGLEGSGAAAGYNLSRLYDQLLEFGNSQRYLRSAREASADLVESWEREGLVAVNLDGGLERISEIRRSLETDRWSLGRLYGSLQSLILAVAVLLLAIVIRWLGFGSAGGWRALEYQGHSALGVWLRRIVPGLRSAEAGDGGRAFAAVSIPISIGLWLVVGVFGYALPWGMEPGRALVIGGTALSLLVFLVVRAVAR